MKWSKVATIVVAGIWLSGAGGDSCRPDGPDVPPHDWTLDDVPEAAVVIHSTELSSDTAFSLKNVLTQIIRTGGATPGNGAEERLIETLTGSMAATTFVNLNSGLAMHIERRDREAGLRGAELLDPSHPNGLIPVGLFNRLDAMPADAKDCGEYRIAYSNRRSNFLLIFEAKMPNERERQVDCARLARFWSALGTGDPASRLAMARQFYFDGVEGFPPAVSAAHYGDKLGQVRSNSILGGEWQLREWRVFPAPASVTFQVQPVADSPLIEFYQDNNNGTLSSSLPLQESERQAFHGEFSTNIARQLTEADRTLPSPLPATMSPELERATIFANLGGKVEPRFNEGQSNAGENPSGRLVSLRGRLTPVQSGDGRRVVDVEATVQRAGVMSCGGCHSFGNGANIGKINNVPLFWPLSNGFTHIQWGDGAPNPISQLLSEAFIPFRRQNMVDFLDRMEAVQPIGRVRLRAGVPPTQPSALFRQIVLSNRMLTARMEEYEAYVRSNVRDDEMKSGLFRRNRSGH